MDYYPREKDSKEHSGGIEGGEQTYEDWGDRMTHVCSIAYTQVPFLHAKELWDIREGADVASNRFAVAGQNPIQFVFQNHHASQTLASHVPASKKRYLIPHGPRLAPSPSQAADVPPPLPPPLHDHHQRSPPRERPYSPTCSPPS